MLSAFPSLLPSAGNVKYHSLKSYFCAGSARSSAHTGLVVANAVASTVENVLEITSQRFWVGKITTPVTCLAHGYAAEYAVRF